MKTFLLTLITWIAVILSAVGVGIFFWGLSRLLKAAGTRRWPTSPGVILTSKVTKRDPPPPGADDFGSDQRRQAPQTLYRAEVTYRYTVDSRELTGAKILLDDIETSSEALARRVVERYPPGSRVTVYRDPSDPARALLEPGIHPSSWLFSGVGLGLAIVAGGLGAFVRWWFLRK